MPSADTIPPPSPLPPGRTATCRSSAPPPTTSPTCAPRPPSPPAPAPCLSPRPAPRVLCTARPAVVPPWCLLARPRAQLCGNRTHLPRVCNCPARRSARATSPLTSSCAASRRQAAAPRWQHPLPCARARAPAMRSPTRGDHVHAPALPTSSPLHLQPPRWSRRARCATSACPTRRATAWRSLHGPPRPRGCPRSRPSRCVYACVFCVRQRGGRAAAAACCLVRRAPSARARCRTRARARTNLLQTQPTPDTHATQPHAHPELLPPAVPHRV